MNKKEAQQRREKQRVSDAFSLWHARQDKTDISTMVKQRCSDVPVNQ